MKTKDEVKRGAPLKPDKYKVRPQDGLYVWQREQLVQIASERDMPTNALLRKIVSWFLNEMERYDDNVENVLSRK